METLRLKIDPEELNSASSRHAIERAAAILRRGGLVAFATETVYGLGGNALDEAAVRKIFLAKQRPGWDPLIVHISGPQMLPLITAGQPLTRAATSLMAAFWPGPLTLLLPKASSVPAAVTAGRTLVGVRFPSHPVAQALLAAAGVPVAAPSANRFGGISPTQAHHVLEDLDGRIDAVLDSGETTHGLESTVVDASVEPVLVYRPGIIGLEEIRRICGAAEQWTPNELTSPAQDETPDSLASPGISSRHYAPRTPLRLVGVDAPNAATALTEAITHARQGYGRIGIMLPTDFPLSGDAPPDTVIYDWGDWVNLTQLAHRLFAGLRFLDAASVDVILCPVPPAEGLGIAIRNRLFKAALAD